MELRFFFIFFLLALLFICCPTSHSIPFILLHGLGQECTKQSVSQLTEYLAQTSGVEGHCLEIGNGVEDSWFMPLDDQIQIVCDKVKSMKQLRNGYNIVAMSQGNLIGRGVVEFCDGAPPVKNFISLAGPHAGVAAIPNCGSALFCLFVDEMIKSLVYTNFTQSFLAPASYLKLPNDIPDYMKNCKFLPKLNNELPNARNSTYKERFSSLQNLVLIMFENDTILIPKETSWFGYYQDQDGSLEVLPPQKTKLYIEDWIGLRSLNKKERVKFISLEGDHLAISKSDASKYVVPYLKDHPSKFSRWAPTLARKLVAEKAVEHAYLLR